MNEQQMWVVLQTLPFLGLLAFLLIGWHLRQLRTLKLMEMRHRERLAAIEKGLAVPEPPREPESMIVIGGVGNGGTGSYERAALASGLVLTLGGAGFLVALSVMAQIQNLSKLAAIAVLGLIPMLVGAGLLLYVVLCRRLDRGSPRSED